MAKISLIKVSSEELDRLLGVSKDTESPLTTTENAVSKDTIPGNNAVSKDTDRATYQREFRKKRYKTVSMDMRHEEVNHFKAWATAHNMSLTEFFRRAGNAYIVSKDTDKP